MYEIYQLYRGLKGSPGFALPWDAARWPMKHFGMIAVLLWFELVWRRSCPAFERMREVPPFFLVKSAFAEIQIFVAFCMLVGGLEHFLFSISYTGCHPSHWLWYFSRWLTPPSSMCLSPFLVVFHPVRHPDFQWVPAAGVAQGAGGISRSQQTKGSAGQESRGGKDAWRSWMEAGRGPFKTGRQMSLLIGWKCG